MIGSSDTPYKHKPPRLIADATTQKMAGNVFATGLQKGQTQAIGALDQNAGKGFSRSASDYTRADQQQAAGNAAAAQGAAGIEAEDQQFNTNQRFDNTMMLREGLAFDYDQATARNSAGFEQRMTKKQNNAAVRNARQQSAMNIRLALLSQGLG